MPELVAAVEAGKVKVSTAAIVGDLPPERQKAAAEAGLSMRPASHA